MQCLYISASLCQNNLQSKDSKYGSFVNRLLFQLRLEREGMEPEGSLDYDELWELSKLFLNQSDHLYYDTG